MSIDVAWRHGDASAALDAAADEVRRGLLGRPRSLPSKFFYDEAGSALFERITELPEYYPTRTETAILRRIADDVARTTGARELAELGSGSSRKTRLLLDALARAGTLREIALLDVAEVMLEESRVELERAYPGVDVRAVAGDFMIDVARLGLGRERLLVFLGSTVGNLAPSEARAFLRSCAGILASGDTFLVGFDLVKDVRRLEAAYNDAQGVTAAFNRNILRAVNHALDGDFDPAAFDHVAFYDRENAWIEMRLRARRPCRVRVRRARVDVELARGEEIRTEISCKYTRSSVEALVAGTGLSVARWETDAEQLFAVALLRPATA